MRQGPIFPMANQQVWTPGSILSRIFWVPWQKYYDQLVGECRVCL